jgi:hypothetical protein
MKLIKYLRDKYRIVFLMLYERHKIMESEDILLQMNYIRMIKIHYLLLKIHFLSFIKKKNILLEIKLKF